MITRIIQLLQTLVVVSMTLAVPDIAAAQEHSPHHVENHHAEHHHVGAELPADKFLPDSVFQLDTEWTSSTGERLKLANFVGTPRVLTMFYSTCTAACPVLVDNVKRIERAIKAAGIPKIGFVLVTFDPARDTEKVLGQYAEKRVLSRDSWVLLRGSEEDTLELAVLLGMKYKQDGAGGFSHSNIISLLDAQGRVVHRQIGLQLADADIEAFVSALRKYGSR